MALTLEERAARQVALEMCAEQYAQLLLDASICHCWACGRTPRDRPAGWYAPWLVERSHIVNKPRAEDRRAVVLACSLCHKGGMHGERFVLAGERFVLPRLRLEHLLWLKRNRDLAYYDRAFLQSKTIKALPVPHRPPVYYLDQYEKRRGRANP
jgi:hypothetical protein